MDSMYDVEKQTLINLLHILADAVHANAVAKGFWEGERNDGEILMLMVSELAEALEAIRHGNPPDQHLPQYDSYTVELADVIIRILDMCAARNLPLPEAIFAKIEFNESRPRKHGKAF